MQRSEQINELIGALTKAQAEFGAVLRKDDNPFYKSKYADLATVIEATKPALLKHGLVIIQGVECEVEAATTVIETMLAHTSGQWISSTLKLPGTQKERFDAQSVGSSITYGRRYAEQAILNVAAEDDDGNAASSNGSKQEQQSVAQSKLPERKVTISYDQEGQMYVSGPGVPFLGNSLRANGATRIDSIDSWVVQAKSSKDVIKDAIEQKVAISNAEFPRSVAPAGKGVAVVESGPGSHTDFKVPRANIPPYTPTYDGLSGAQAGTTPGPISTDPHVPRCVEGNNGKKGKEYRDWLNVSWNGGVYKCFDKKLWSALQLCEKLGEPAELILSEHGKYKNVEGIAGYELAQDGEHRKPIQQELR